MVVAWSGRGEDSRGAVITTASIGVDEVEPYAFSGGSKVQSVRESGVESDLGSRCMASFKDPNNTLYIKFVI